MNPYSPEQKYPRYLVRKALENCQQEKENAEFFIEVKESLVNTVRQGQQALSREFWDEDIVLGDGTIIPSPRRLLEQEEQYHIEGIERQKALLEDIKDAELALDNSYRKHRQNYESINLHKLKKKQLRYDKRKQQEDNYKALREAYNDIRERISKIKQELSASSSSNLSASIKNDD